MVFYDFEYDGLSLSEQGYIVCTFGKGSNNTVSGSQITLNTISTHKGIKFETTSYKYENCLQSTFSICKNLCDTNDLELSIEDIRLIERWLCRNKFKRFRVLSNEYYNYYFEAIFNINYIERGGKIVGLELNMTTNSPFAHLSTVMYGDVFLWNDGKLKIIDESDVEGHIYPKLQIEMLSNGDLTISNSQTNKSTIIKNCRLNEKITLEYPIIQSDNDNHDLANDFNWNFVKIFNGYYNSDNVISFSLPCVVKLEYSPLVKIGI